MVKKYGNIMTLMNKFAHITNLKLFSKQSFGELTPLRLEIQVKVIFSESQQIT
jgi:hypothetical protein